MGRIVLDGLTFEGDGSSAPGFYFRELTDWFARAESKSDVNERPQADGAFGIGTDWLSSLAISFKGHFQGDSAADVVAAMRTLNALGVGGRKVDMQFQDDLGVTSRRVSIRRVTPDDYRGRKYVRFAVDVVAADPLAYGAEVLVGPTGPGASGGGLLFPLGVTPSAFWDFGADGASGRLSVTNVGTAAVWPTLSVVGGVSAGFVVTDVTTGDSVRFERPIPDGSMVVINQRTGRASIDGQSDVSGFITRREFFDIPPGATHQLQFAVLGVAAGSPQLSVALSPAFV